MATSYNTRTKPNTSYNPRIKISGVVMSIITTGFYDDTQVWEDEKTWIDIGGTTFETQYTTRPII